VADTKEWTLLQELFTKRLRRWEYPWARVQLRRRQHFVESGSVTALMTSVSTAWQGQALMSSGELGACSVNRFPTSTTSVATAWEYKGDRWWKMASLKDCATGLCSGSLL
jgi:hypothetical protein